MPLFEMRIRFKVQTPTPHWVVFKALIPANSYEEAKEKALGHLEDAELMEEREPL